MRGGSNYPWALFLKRAVIHRRRRRPAVAGQVRSPGAPSLRARKLCRLTLTVRVTMARQHWEPSPSLRESARVGRRPKKK